MAQSKETDISGMEKLQNKTTQKTRMVGSSRSASMSSSNGPQSQDGQSWKGLSEGNIIPQKIKTRNTMWVINPTSENMSKGNETSVAEICALPCLWKYY